MRTVLGMTNAEPLGFRSMIDKSAINAGTTACSHSEYFIAAGINEKEM